MCNFALFFLLTKIKTMKEVNASEIAEMLLQDHKLPIKESKAVLKLINGAIIKSLCQQLEAGVEVPRVELHGIGVFKLKVTEEVTKRRRNPATGEYFEKHYPRSAKVTFHTAGALNKIANAYLNL
jgi:nucleoid DNA-binding protein